MFFIIENIEESHQYNRFPSRDNFNHGPHAIIKNMVLKHEMQDYRLRWKAVEEIQTEERRTATFELRWRQLNAAFGIGQVLGLLQPDLSEMEIFKRWAKIKEKAISRTLET